MPNATTLTMTIDELMAERRALSLVIERRKDALDKAIFKQEQPVRYALWLQFLSDNERDLLHHAHLTRLIDGLCQKQEA